jgi:hypothetical protein
MEVIDKNEEVVEIGSFSFNFAFLSFEKRMMYEKASLLSASPSPGLSSGVPTRLVKQTKTE